MTSYENETQQTSETFDNTIVIMAGTAIDIHRLCGKHRHVAGQYLCDRAAGGDPLRIAGGIGEYSIGTRIRTVTGKHFRYTRIAAGYICNRLQLAVFREMVDLVERGVCTVEEADKALTFGPAIRWAIFGHNMIMQLGNKDGLKGMMDMLAGGFNLCADIAAWDTIPADYGTKAQKEMDEIMKNLPDEVGHTNAEIAQYRDKMLIDILKLHHKF